MDPSAKTVKVFIRELSSKSKFWVGFAILKIEWHWSFLSDTFIQPISLTLLIWFFFFFLNYLLNFYFKQNTLCCHLAPQNLVVNRLSSQNIHSVDWHPFLRKNYCCCWWYRYLMDSANEHEQGWGGNTVRYSSLLMVFNTTVQKTSLLKKQGINAFLAKVVFPPV